MNIIHTILNDVDFQTEHYFPINNVKSIFAICHPKDVFIRGILDHKTVVCSITNLASSEHIADAEYIRSAFHNKYKYITDATDILLHSYSAIYIATGTIDIDSVLLRQMLPAMSTLQVIFTTHPTLQTVTLSPEYIALPIVTNFSVVFRCKTPLTITWLRNIYKPYNFNSSCVAIDKNTAKPSFIETSGTDLLFSVRVSNSKFTESDLVFLKNDTILDEQLVCNPTCREDLRFFVWKGELYGSYTFITPYIAGVPTFQKLMVGKFNVTKYDITLCTEIVPLFGHNLTETSKGRDWIKTTEKNWTWWEAPNGKLHCAYMFSPLTILEFDSLEKVPREIQHEEDITCIPKGVRGGACGVVYDGKVWCFTHTSTENSIMNIGVVVLSYDNKPRVLGYCHEVVASKDYWNCIFYTCGAVFSATENCWKLTGGIHDTASFVLRLKHEEVLKKICWI